MRKNRLKVMTIIVLGMLLLGCKQKEFKEEIIRPVVVLDLAKEQQMHDINFPGIVVADNDTTLAFKIPGSISKINVLPGDFVKKGDIIATLDTSDYNVNLEANKKQYDAAKAGYENMAAQYKRAVILHDGKAMSDKNFDIVTAQYKASKATLKAAEQGVKNAMNRVEDTKLRAPYDGYIGKKIMDEGSVVTAAEPVVKIVSQEMPRVDINIAGKDIDTIQKAESFTFRTANKTYILKLAKVGKNTDLLKLTYPVTFDFIDSAAKDLIIGTTGTVVANIANENHKEITVPLTALFEKDGSNVYLYNDGVVKSQKVELGALKSNGNITITKGLNRTDKVIIAGVHTVTEGEKVKVIQQPSETNVGGVL